MQLSEVFEKTFAAEKAVIEARNASFQAATGNGVRGAGGLEGVILQVSVPKIIYYLHHFLLKEQKFIHMLTKQQCNQNHMQCAEIYPRGGYKERIVNFACL